MSYTLSLDHIPKRDHLSLPDLPEDAFDAWHGFQIDLGLTTAHLSLAQLERGKLPAIQTGVLKLSSEATPLPDLVPASSSVLSAHSENSSDVGVEQKLQSLQQDDEDIWAATEVHNPQRKTELLSWDHFKNEAHQEPPCTYISEAGDRVFDILMTKSTSKDGEDTSKNYARPNILLNALLDLGLGRSSAFFKWEQGDKCFKKVVPDIALTGYSEQSLDQILNAYLDMGAHFVAVQKCTENLARRGPVQVALGSAITTILNAIRGHVEREWHKTQTILQLQELCCRPATIVRLLARAADAFQSERSVTELIARVASWTAEVSLEVPMFEHTANHVLFRTIEPELQTLRSHVGLIKDSSHTQSFGNSLASLLPKNTNELIQSSTESLHILRTMSTEYTLLHAFFADAQHFSIRSSWDEISNAQHLASAYEQDVLMKFLNVPATAHISSSPNDPDLHAAATISRPSMSATSPFALDLQIFEAGSACLNNGESRSDNSLHETTAHFLSDRCALPIIPAVPYRQAIDLSITPLLMTQHRLLSYSALNLLFKDCKLLIHLDALYRFQLLTDGVFASRLTMALFGAEQISGEGPRATNATTGLRLQSRETWPPASSELRLVLLDILSASIVGMHDQTLDESISFAIRDLSDEELERCRDVNSIHALDFLRILYKPPHGALEAIITSTVLAKYDRIFMYLLRLLRLKDLAQHLLRRACARSGAATNNHTRTSDHKLSLAIQHFVSALANHSQLAITTAWTRFENTLSQVQICLETRDYEGTIATAGSLDVLRRMHEDTLDEIIEALLLKQRQHKARAMLEDIFGLVLKFAAASSSSSSSSSTSHPRPATLSSLNLKSSKASCDEFCGKVGRFVQLLRQMIDLKVGAGAGARAGAANKNNQEGSGVVLESLLLSVDFNGYYSKKSGRPEPGPAKKQ